MTLFVEARAVPPFMENSYVVGADGEALLVDPGGGLEALAQVLEAQGLRPVAAVLTHGHIDHLAVAAEARRRFGIPLWAHADERPLVASTPMQAAMFGFPGVETPPVDRWLADGEELRVGGHAARVIHTPGHSPGGICLYFEADRTVFTGDTLFAGSIGRSDLPGGDGETLLRSIRERLFTLPESVVFYPGHGPSGTLGDERRTNPFVRG